MYYAMRASAPSLHRESTDSLIHVYKCFELYYEYGFEFFFPENNMTLGTITISSDLCIYIYKKKELTCNSLQQDHDEQTSALRDTPFLLLFDNKCQVESY